MYKYKKQKKKIIYILRQKYQKNTRIFTLVQTVYVDGRTIFLIFLLFSKPNRAKGQRSLCVIIKTYSVFNRRRRNCFFLLFYGGKRVIIIIIARKRYTQYYETIPISCTPPTTIITRWILESFDEKKNRPINRCDRKDRFGAELGKPVMGFLEQLIVRFSVVGPGRPGNRQKSKTDGQRCCCHRQYFYNYYFFFEISEKLLGFLAIF